MPVHLGSMDRAVETVIRENKGSIAPGDAYAINAPYNGGTHLPDITVCTPVFAAPSYPSPLAEEGTGGAGDHGASRVPGGEPPVPDRPQGGQKILFWVAS